MLKNISLIRKICSFIYGLSRSRCESSHDILFRFWYIKEVEYVPKFGASHFGNAARFHSSRLKAKKEYLAGHAILIIEFVAIRETTSVEETLELLKMESRANSIDNHEN
jgi:hypothetical protein